MEREEERGSSVCTIWIEQCGAGRWDNEWQGGGELLSRRRKAQMQSNGHFLSSTCIIGTLRLLYWDGSQKRKYVSVEVFQWG